jgi:hypothetical protein
VLIEVRNVVFFSKTQKMLRAVLKVCKGTSSAIVTSTNFSAPITTFLGSQLPKQMYDKARNLVTSTNFSAPLAIRFPIVKKMYEVARNLCRGLS